MNRLAIAVSLGSLLFFAGAAAAQESAKLELTVKVSDKIPSFSGQRLVVILGHKFPNQDDRGAKTVDRYVDAKFSHEKGKETVLKLTLGDKAKLKRDVQYTVSVTVFTPASQPTHHGELNRHAGPFFVLTNGCPNKLTLTVVPDR